MTKKIEWRVVCPHCEMVQTYHSHNSQVKNTRSKECNRCQRSFVVKKRRLKNLPQIKKKLQEEQDNKGTGFHKYSRSGGSD